MNIKKAAINALTAINADKLEKIDELSNKDGVHVYRLSCGKNSYVFKFFSNEQYKCEIEYYKILESIQIPTILVLHYGEDYILLEDIHNHPHLRLGEPEDMNNEHVICCIAKWYKKLHSKGKAVAKSKVLNSEHDMFTIENIDLIRKRSDTQASDFWNVLINNYNTLEKIYKQFEKTLVYNDFYHTNMIVSHDYSQAFMFDYNMMGIGYGYADLRNVTYPLSDNLKQAFLKEYGEYNTTEKLYDDLFSHINTLISAYNKEVFPNWAKHSLELLYNGTLEKSLYQLI